MKLSNAYGSNYFGVQLSSRFILYSGADILQVRLREEIQNTEASVALFLPNVGFRLLLKEERNEEVTPYFSLGLLRSLATLDLRNFSALHDYLSEDDEKLLEDLLDFWVINPALGAEYSFSHKFSLGGEFGFRLLFASGKLAKWGDYYFLYSGTNLPNNGSKVHLDVNRTYTAICLNFRF